MKAGAKNRREEREQVNIMKSQVKEMRKAALAIQFKEWTVDVSDRIPVTQVTRDDPFKQHCDCSRRGNGSLCGSAICPGMAA